jgi:CubicO group peptidase (beta-lactamase class C family)
VPLSLRTPIDHGLCTECGRPAAICPGQEAAGTQWRFLGIDLTIRLVGVTATLTRRRFGTSVGIGVAGLITDGWHAVAAMAGVADQSGEGKSSFGDGLDAFVRARMESVRVPGLSLATIRHGKLEHAMAFGFANLEQQRPMRADTLINIASVTKTVTCIAVMQLWERKQFPLDADVNAYLSFPVRNFAYPEVPVTFRQLLTHTSSIADGPALDKSYACGDSRVPLGTWLRDYLTPGGALFDPQSNFHPWKPGMQYEYSNVAYGLLGHLVESISGMSYSEYILKRVFEALGMSHSRILLAGMDSQSHATPYTYSKDGDLAAVELRDPVWAPPADRLGGVQVPHCLYSWATPPDGGARTSALELSRLLRAFMNGGKLDGPRVLQSSTIARILSDQHVPFASTQAKTQIQGLTWRRYGGLGPGIVWGHNGLDPGVSTFIVFRPHDRRGAVILMNGDGGFIAAQEIAKRVLAQ